MRYRLNNYLLEEMIITLKDDQFSRVKLIRPILPGTELENFTKGGENRKIQLHDWAIIQSNCQRQKAIDSLKILLEKSPEIKVMVKEKRE
jgi:hypothetical protein